MTYTQGMPTSFEWWPRSEQTTVATTVTVYTPLETVDELSMDHATVNEASRESQLSCLLSSRGNKYLMS